MNRSKLIAILLLIAISTSIFFSTHVFSRKKVGLGLDVSDVTSESLISSQWSVDRLVKLVRAQNATIATMSLLLENSPGHHAVDNQDTSGILAAKVNEISRLKSQLELLKNQQQTNIMGAATADSTALKEENERLKTENSILRKKSAEGRTSITDSSRTLVIHTPPSTLEDSCERRYGLSLVSEWKTKAEIWCGSGVTSAFDLPTSESKLICYPYTQQHRIVSRQGGPDTICVATNFVIDFAKVSGDIGHSKLSNYLGYKMGALQASCKRTSQYAPQKLHKHLQNYFSSFTDGVQAASDIKIEEIPTFLFTRDEDCENSFHSTADFMNMFVAANVIGLHPSEQQVILWDRHPDGPYVDLIQKAFAGGRKVLRHQSYEGKKVLFKKLIFHMESPAGLIFPKVANPEQLRCKGTGLFKEYAKHVLHSFNLWNVPPPEVPHVTLLLRHRTETKNVGRILANVDDVVNVLSESNMVTYQVTDTAKMPYAEQLALIRKTNILVGVHGAGLMLILFAANEAVLVEIHPSYRQDRHFRHAARMAGKDYLPLRATERESCQGSSDNVKVPIAEFRLAMDGAIRLARGYDNGISECGRICPAGILALDKTLEPMYGPNTRSQKGSPINTQFPC